MEKRRGLSENGEIVWAQSRVYGLLKKFQSSLSETKLCAQQVFQPTTVITF